MKRFSCKYPAGGVVFVMSLGFALLSVAFFYSLAECCAGGAKPPRKWDVVRPESCLANVYVCPSAQLSKASYFISKTKDGEISRLQFKITVKNISDSPMRYQVSLSVPDGPSAQGLCPKKEEAELLNPGQERILMIPLDIQKNPDTVIVSVEEVPSDMLVEKAANFVNKMMDSIVQWSSTTETKRERKTVRIFSES